MINGSSLHLVFLKYSVIQTASCIRGCLRLLQVYQLLGVNEQTIMVSSWFALLTGCACGFTWSQAGGASVKCPPLINHVPAVAAFSDLGAKALALETAWDVAGGQACEALKSSQVTPRTPCFWARRKRSSNLCNLGGSEFVSRVLFLSLLQECKYYRHMVQETVTGVLPWLRTVNKLMFLHWYKTQVLLTWKPLILPLSQLCQVQSTALLKLLA